MGIIKICSNIRQVYEKELAIIMGMPRKGKELLSIHKNPYLTLLF